MFAHEAKLLVESDLKNRDNPDDDLQKLIRSTRRRNMSWRYRSPQEAMVFDWRRYSRLALVSRLRAQSFLGDVLREWLMIGELTFAEELAVHFDTAVFPIGVAAQEISFFFRLPRVPGLIRRLIDQVRPRASLEGLDTGKSEYVEGICRLADIVVRFEEGESTLPKLVDELQTFRSTDWRVNCYYFEVVGYYRPILGFSEVMPMYEYFQAYFLFKDNQQGDFIRCLRRLIREERVAHFRQKQYSENN